MRVNKKGNIERKVCGHGRKGAKYSDVYLVKPTESNSGMLNLTGNLIFPKDYVGKKVRLKVEVIQDSSDDDGLLDLMKKEFNMEVHEDYNEYQKNYKRKRRSISKDKK